MKTHLFYLLTFISIKSFGFDWDFYQMNQKSFYQRNYFTTTQPTTINEMFADSMVNNLSVTEYYFLKKYHGRNNSTCYPNISSSYYPFNFLERNDADSILINGDTIRIYRGNFGSSDSTTFLFLRTASVNQSWTISSTAVFNIFPDLVVTCISAQPETFLGITDSVKTFSLHGFNGATPVSSFYDTIQIKLSKNYGLIHLISFENFIRHSAIYDGCTSSLVGFDNGISQPGFQAPVTTDFIHYHPGEVYLWKWEIHPMPGPNRIDYYRDSITQVNTIGDTIQWIYDSQVLDYNGVLHNYTNLVGTYVLNNNFKDIFEAPTSSVVIGCADLNGGPGFCTTPNGQIALSASLVPDSLGGVPVLKREFFTDGGFVDTVNCNIYHGIDDDHSLSANTLQGITETCWTSFFFNCMTLIGSSINNSTTGNIVLSADIKSMNESTSDFRIFPNPVNTELNVELKKSFSKLSYKIFNVLGETVFSDFSNSKKLNASKLNPGIYFLEVTDGIKTYRERFLKD